MKNMTLLNIAKACGSELKGSTTEETVTGVVLDSRLIQEGNLFIATKGEKVDGHSFIPQVAAKGAAAVVCEEVPEADIPYILVEDSFQALKDIAAFYRQQLSIPVVGITGSVGKTSTKEFIGAVLGEKYRVLKTEGNYNNEVGLPLTVLRIREEHQAAVLEMGISDFGEMHRLSAIAQPDICVLTNIGQCHLENLGSREGILKAKTEIFDYMKEDGFVCVNGDDDMLAAVDKVKGKKPFCFGIGPANRVYAEKIENRGLLGSKAVIHVEDDSFTVEIPLPGEHMIYNALAAVCVGSLLGVKKEEMIKGIGHLQAVGGRSNVIKLPAGILIDDCYNANPVSMKAALDLLQLAPFRKVAVLGDMFELGEGEASMHEEIGRYAMSLGTDVLICIGKLSEHMYQAAKEMVNRNAVHYFSDKQSFLEKANGILKPEDTVLFKASHGMAFETLVTEFQTSSLFLK